MIEAAKKKALCVIFLLVLIIRDELTIDGVQYDYVWPIEFDTPGMGTPKLGYNMGG